MNSSRPVFGKIFPLHRYGFGFLFILLIAILMRGPSLGSKSLWVDEIITATVSVQGMAAGIRYAAGDVTPPLLYLLTALSMKLGESEAIVRLQAFVFGLIGLIVMIWVGRLFLEKRRSQPDTLADTPSISIPGGLIAGALLTLSPFHLFHSQDARMYALFMTFSLLAFGCEHRFWFLREEEKNGSRRQKLWLLGWVLATLANLYTTYFALFVLAGQGLSFVLECWNHRSDQKLKRIILMVLGSWILVGVGYLPWLPSFIRFLAKETVSTGGSPGSIGMMIEGIYSRFGPQQTWGNLLFAGLAFVGLFHDSRLRKLSLFQFLPPMLYLLGFRSSHFFTIRYLSFLLPVYLLLVAAGLIRIARWFNLEKTFQRRIIYWIVCGSCILLLSVPSISRYYRTEKQNWRAVADYLAPRLQSGDRIISGKNSVGTCLSYYLARHSMPSPVFIVEGIRTEEQLLQELEKPGRVWLVHAWRESTSKKFLMVVYTRFEIQGSYSALEDWGEIFIFFRPENSR